ncbi:MAG: GNVR domain-containing protein, partial [Bacteroidaceae bacterium]|nr:GNVR domain-containing protein [Bacteroidaceae bacterium]
MSEQYIESQQTFQTEEKQDLDIFSILQICISVFLKNWKWFFLSVVICCLFGALFIKKQPRVYSQHATLLIEDNDNNGNYSRNSAVNAMKQLNGVQVTDNLKNEIYILQSRRLMETVVDRLHLDVNYSTTEGLQPITLYKVKPFNAAFLSRYFACTSFDVDVLSNNTVKITDVKIDGNKVDFEREVSYGQVVNTPAGKICLTRADKGSGFIGKVIQVSRLSKEKAISQFNAAVTADEFDKEASLIVLSCKDTNEDRAQAILNTLLNVYKQDIIQSKNSVATNTANFIEKRIKLIGSELSDVENKLAQYKKSNNIVDFTENAKSFLQQSSLSQQQLNEVQAQLSVANYLREYIRENANNNKSLIPDLGGLGNTGMQTQIGQYNDMVLQYTRLSANSSSVNSVIQDQEKALESMRATIRASLDNYVNSLKLQVNKAQSVDNGFQSAMSGIPQKEIRALDISRQQTIKEALYTYLLNKREEVALQLAINEANVRIVEYPYGLPKPISPRTDVILIISFLLGLIIPSIVLWAKIQMDTFVRSRKDVEETMTAPILGEIPEWIDET